MAVRLVNAPIGLFEIDGVLVLKTEYCTKHEDGTVTADCYIVDSGEYFWGGVESAEERNNLMVTPVDMPTLTPPNEPLTCTGCMYSPDCPSEIHCFGCARLYTDHYRRPPEGEEGDVNRG